MEQETGKRIGAAGAVLRLLEPEGKALDLPVSLCSYLHLGS